MTTPETSTRNTLLGNAGVIKAQQLGHDLEWDPPAAMTSVLRWTCRNCRAALLVSPTVAYGSAVTDDCTSGVPGV